MSAVTQWATGCFREKGAVRGMLLEILNLLCGFPGAGRCFMTKASSKLQHDYKRFQVWEIWLFQREGMLSGKHSASSTAVYCLAIHIVLGVCVLGLLFLSQIINRSSFKYMIIIVFLLCFGMISEFVRSTPVRFKLLCDSNLFPCLIHSLSSWIVFLLELGKPWPLIADINC